MTPGGRPASFPVVRVRCVSLPGDMNVAPTWCGALRMWLVGLPGDMNVAPTFFAGHFAVYGRPIRGDARRGATCDARLRGAPGRSRQTMRAVRFRVAAPRYGAWACGRLRQFSVRHLCRPYVSRYGGGECGGGSSLFPPERRETPVAGRFRRGGGAVHTAGVKFFLVTPVRTFFVPLRHETLPFPFYCDCG